MDWQPVPDAVFSPRHEPTTRHHTPTPARRHNPDRKDPSKPKGAHEPTKPKSGHHDRAKQPAKKGHHKSAPRGAEQASSAVVVDPSHIPTLGTLPNRKRSNA